jgi:endonuclease G
MNDDPMTIARARLALRQAIYYHLSDPNVTLIEFGFKQRAGQIVADELALRFHLRRKLHGPALETAVERGQTRPIPPSIGLFKTDVAQGTYYPHWQAWPGWSAAPKTNPRALQTTPMRGGLSISAERRHAYGTLGGLVIDQATGAELILSNWHVLAADWSARPGQRIYQPGRLDGGTPAHTIATLTRHAMTANLDAAVATLIGNRPLLNDQLDLGPIRGLGQPSLGMRVVKSGRRTAVTTGQIIAIEGIAKIQYGSIERLIQRVLTIEPDRPSAEVSGPGDSGSIWLDQATMHAVGLHFAGSNQPERALAMDITPILETLKVNLATGG